MLYLGGTMIRNWHTRSFVLACLLSAPLGAGAIGCSSNVPIGEDPVAGGVGGGAGTLGTGGGSGSGGSAGTGNAGSGAAGNGGAAGTGTAGAAGSGGVDVCSLPQQSGPCLAAFPRWWFNSETGLCEPFLYGGCGGNANNFASQAACRVSCGPEDCRPMDAQGQGNCTLLLGYRWDGQACVSEAGCSCVGPDCGKLASTQEQCASAHAQCDDPGCGNEQRALQDFINGNKSCAVDADCQVLNVGCGITEDECTGTVYVNTRTELSEFEALRHEYYACVGTCAGCDRASPPPVCLGGVCQRKALP
jgi:hypothetical protein